MGYNSTDVFANAAQVQSALVTAPFVVNRAPPVPSHPPSFPAGGGWLGFPPAPHTIHVHARARTFPFMSAHTWTCVHTPTHAYPRPTRSREEEQVSSLGSHQHTRRTGHRPIPGAKCTAYLLGTSSPHVGYLSPSRWPPPVGLNLPPLNLAPWPVWLNLANDMGEGRYRIVYPSI